MRGDASIVYLHTGRLLLDPPGRIAFHRSARSEWPRYIPDLEATDVRGYLCSMVDPEHDRERHWTACGLLTYDSYSPRKIVMAGIRRDNAVLVGRPCRRCWG